MSDAFNMLETHTASTSAELDFTTWYSSSYDEYEIHILNLIPDTNGVTLQLQCSTDGGSTYDTGNNYTVNLFDFNSGGQDASQGGGASQSSIKIGTSVSSTNTSGISYEVVLCSPGSTVLNKYFYGEGIELAGSYVGWQLASLYVNTAAVNAFRIKFSSGNIASGIVRIYGISATVPPVAVPVSGLLVSNSEEGGFEIIGCPISI